MSRFKEDALQMQVAQYLDLKKVTWTHVANERKTSPQAGARLKRKGVKSGVPDIMIFDGNREYCGLAIELKIGKNKPTENQKKWLEILSEKGWYTEVCYSFDDARQVIDSYRKLA